MKIATRIIFALIFLCFLKKTVAQEQVLTIENSRSDFGICEKSAYETDKKEGGVLIAQQGGNVIYNEAENQARLIEKFTKLREQEEQGGNVGYNEADERARRIEKATKLREKEEQGGIFNSAENQARIIEKATKLREKEEQEASTFSHSPILTIVTISTSIIFILTVTIIIFFALYLKEKNKNKCIKQ